MTTNEVTFLHRHSWEPYALLDDDEAAGRGVEKASAETPSLSRIYYVGYRCKECGEAGYVVP